MNFAEFADGGAGNVIVGLQEGDCVLAANNSNRPDFVVYRKWDDVFEAADGGPGDGFWQYGATIDSLDVILQGAGTGRAGSTAIVPGQPRDARTDVPTREPTRLRVEGFASGHLLHSKKTEKAWHNWPLDYYAMIGQPHTIDSMVTPWKDGHVIGDHLILELTNTVFNRSTPVADNELLNSPAEVLS